MTNPLKNLVSKKKRRYKEDGFDLDLSYIKRNIIAMGYPAEKLEGAVIRNHIDDVFKFLESKHKDHYWIYNLCSEKSYDNKKFKNRVSCYPFDDHNPPKLETIRPFCEDVHRWLSEDTENVAVVHCKAGKGRTGVMICCYLLHSGIFNMAEEALNHYGQKRTLDRKGVTIPSQRRYVKYYAMLVDRKFEYKELPLYIRSMKLKTLPHCNSAKTFNLKVTVSIPDNECFKSRMTVLSNNIYEVKKNDSYFMIEFEDPLYVCGDVKVEFCMVGNMIKRKNKLFQFWFNTFFINKCDGNYNNGFDIYLDSNGQSRDRLERAMSCPENASATSSVNHVNVPSEFLERPGSMSVLAQNDEQYILVLNIDDLDRAHKEKETRLSPDFKVIVFFTKCAQKNEVRFKNVPESLISDSPNNWQDSPSSSDTDDGEWESGGSIPTPKSPHQSFHPCTKLQRQQEHGNKTQQNRSSAVPCRNSFARKITCFQLDDDGNGGD